MEEDVVEACKSNGILIQGLNEFAISQTDGQYLVISYRGIDDSLVEQGIHAIGDVINQIVQ